MHYKQTEVCQACAQLKHVCQTCLLGKFCHNKAWSEIVYPFYPDSMYEYNLATNFILVL